AATGTFTGPRGGYSLDIGTSGRWLVQFSAAGCDNPGNYAPQWWRDASTPKHATLLRARRGRNFRGISATLRPGAAISGTVRAAGGSHQALRGVCVTAVGLGAMRDIEQMTATHASGAYRLRSLGTG